MKLTKKSFDELPKLDKWVVLYLDDNPVGIYKLDDEGDEDTPETWIDSNEFVVDGEVDEFSDGWAYLPEVEVEDVN